MGRGRRLRVHRGSVVQVNLDPTLGHEQRGVRPCVLISDPEIASDQRYSMLGVAPITGTPGEGALYPPLSPGSSGLLRTSYALLDQIRSVDKRRVRKIFGRVSAAELRAIDEGLRLFLGLTGEEAE
ncbi:MAG: type II toxin-antitoxin system PemK/MazF family toxin [Gemmatimonadota bacterium]